MMALGCIKAVVCDSGRYPVGVATQNPALFKSLDAANKGIRVASFHAGTITDTREIMEACGFAGVATIHPSRFFRLVNELETKSFEQIYFSHGDSTAPHRLKPVLN